MEQFLIDKPLAGIIGRIIAPKCPKTIQILTWMETDKIKGVLTPLGENFQHSSFPRDPAVINWMIAHKWHIDGESDHSRYFFSSVFEKFRYIAWQIYDEKRINRGFLTISLATKDLYVSMKILDYQTDFENPEPIILNFVLKQALRRNVNQLEFGHQFEEAVKTNEILVRILTRHERKYFVYFEQNSPYRGKEAELVLDYCDGDRPHL